MIKNIKNEVYLIAGSISKKTQKSLIEQAHNFVRALTKSILDTNGSLVVYLTEEPINESKDALIFDWTIVQEIDKLKIDYDINNQLKIITSRLAFQQKISSEKRHLLLNLVKEKIAELIYLDDDLVTGGNISDKQVEIATAMIALGGGKGVLDRAHKMRKAGHPILPFDLQLGSLNDDGNGALTLHSNFFKEPQTMFPYTGQTVKGQLDMLSLQEALYTQKEISDMAVQLFKKEREQQSSLCDPDVLILTAIPIELAAAKKIFGIKENIRPCMTTDNIHYWKTSIQRSDGQILCALASFANAGNINASNITTSLLHELKPKKVVMIGIAAGRRGEMLLGEVIISERVVYYESAAALEGGNIASRPEIKTIDMSTQQDLNTYISSLSLLDRLQSKAMELGFTIPAESPAGNTADKLKVSLATIASGELLIRDANFFDKIKLLHGKIAVADMEAYGIFDACNKKGIPALVIRGISDYGDKTKDNTFHKIASEAAAIITFDYLTNGCFLL